MYHGNDNQPDDFTTILECLVSLISTVHSSIGNLTLSLNVFLFLLFLFRCLQNALCKRGHENTRTNVSKTGKKNKKNKKKEAHINTFSPPMRCH